MATLAIYRGDQLERTLEIGEGPIRIGRAPENDLVLEGRDKGVSRAHAEIRYQRGRYVIVDLDSQNGVWLGDRRVKEEDLPVGAPVTIGPYRLILEASPDAVTLPGTEPSVPVTDERDEVVSEPTQIARATPSSSGTELAPPPESAPRSRRPLAAIAAVGVLAVVVLAVAVSKLGDTPDAEPVPTTTATTTAPPATTTSIPPETPAQTPEEQFKEHYDKAKALIATNDITGAKVENDLAMESPAADQSGLKQREEIAALLNPPPPPDPAAPKLPAGQPLVEYLRVVPRKGETPRQQSERQKTAITFLDDGIRYLQQRDYGRAKDMFDAAIRSSGREDFGRFRSQAQQLTAEALGSLKEQQDLQEKADARKLVEEASKLAPSDIAGALGVAEKARKLDPGAAGLSDLISGLLERARGEGEKALVAAMNFDARPGRRLDALAQFEIAARLLGLLPQGHESLAYARQRRDELRKQR